jgi:uncharacterized protein YhaN
MEKTLRDPGLIEVEIDNAREELNGIHGRRAALNTAISTLREATERIHADFAPDLNERIGELAKELTNGRYETAMVGDDFSISVRSSEAGTIVPVRNLSSGARDQLFFAARMALADALAGGRENMPLLLDDSFVEYDPERAAQAFNLLKNIASSRQVILFTCHDRERNLARTIFAENFTHIDLEM